MPTKKKNDKTFSTLHIIQQLLYSLAGIDPVSVKNNKVSDSLIPLHPASLTPCFKLVYWVVF